MNVHLLVGIAIVGLVLFCNGCLVSGSLEGTDENGFQMSGIPNPGKYFSDDLLFTELYNSSWPNSGFFKGKQNLDLFNEYKRRILSERNIDTSSIQAGIQSNSVIPNISSYRPASGYNSNPSQEIMISGSNFFHGITANLTNGTYRQKNSTSVQYTDSGNVTSSFNLQGVHPGRYWIEVLNPDGIESPKNFNLTWGSNDQFYLAWGDAVDSNGNLYVTDLGNNRIQKFNSNGEYITQWGSAGSNPGQFIDPSGICVDSNNNVYVTDTFNNRIQKFSSNGEYITQWGFEGSGPGQFSYPRGIGYHSSGYVYVTDTDNNRIQIFNSDGVYIGQWGSQGSDSGQFNYPDGVCVDNIGNVYIGDTGNNRIQKFSSDGKYITQWGSEGSGPGQFVSPEGVCVDNGGNVFVADTANSRIQKFSSEGIYISQWGFVGGGPCQYLYPMGICVDTSGNVYVVDTGNKRIQKTSSSGVFIMDIGNPGPGVFNEPYRLCVDDVGNVYVADTGNHRVQKFTSEGSYITQWGFRGSGPGQFFYPAGICTDSSGYVYVVDFGNHRIQKFNSEGTYMTQWGTYGPGPGQFRDPFDICADNSGNVYVLESPFDANSRIQKFTSNGAYISQWGLTGEGMGICIDSSGNIYVIDNANSRIQKFTNEGTYITQWGSKGSGPGQLREPRGITVLNSGNVYVADFGNNRIQKFSSTGTYLTEWNTPYPWGICIDNSDNVFNTDWYHANVWKFSDVSFLVTDPFSAQVTGISPNSGISGSYVPFILTGSNFVSGAMVNLSKEGQTNITTTGILTRSDLSGSFAIPSGTEAGLWNVSVNQNGQFSNNNVQFTIHPALPVITNLNPGGCLQNSQLSPFQVIITGTGFDTVSATNNVTVDGSIVPYIIESSTRINATFPEIIDNSLGNHPVIVKGVSGSSTPTNFVVSANGFIIDASSDEIGWINPTGVFSAVPGTSLIFNFKPTAGARIKNLTVNGVEQSTEPPFVIPSVDRDYTIRLNNEPLPGIVIAAFKVQSGDGNTVTFTDKSWGGPNIWKWDFGDGSFGTGNLVSHTYSTPGIYSVSLWARNDFSQSVVVNGDITIPIPGEAGSLTFGP